ncbi:glycine betaine ABC transporter substrate-binding protein [Anaerotalea alkaliphila]|uniref:ABC transporter substrate-binding protein n=1 Tax=Anaerotalea alkaliphila TaxID=2662126 RepID=A0A7X5HUB9_9FIRM|nr:glycine betaine ABC transporter substrate-binding protein [Anaerotalea alkaliphila]NDL66816.1 ABC transporter substrate-binding protein [Anaerotalea alkaliphila]
MKKRIASALLLALALLAACGKPAAPQGGTETQEPAAGAEAAAPVVVATMLDSEGGILGKMMIQMLNSNGIETVDKVNFGTPDILRRALENKEVDLVLDYTGSGQYYHPEEAGDPSIWNDPQQGYELTAQLDLEKNNILWLTPASANNTEMIAVKRSFSEENGIRSMEELAAYINGGNPFKLICSASFAENMMGLLGYEEAYGFKLRDDQLIVLSSGNTAEMLKALSEGTNDVNASLVYGTDGALDIMNLVVLEDPEQVPPVYLPAPVLRGEVAAAYPEIESILKPVFESLTLETLQTLNAQVAYEGKDAAAVAEEYLKGEGFLQ